MSDGYLEPGGSWWPFWAAAAVLTAFVVLDKVAGSGEVPAGLWVLASICVLGFVAGSCRWSRRLWTVRVGRDGDDAALTVGRERVRLTDIDAGHLVAARAGKAGVDAGAPVLGGGWSLPPGRAGMPLRLTDGRTVLVPTRDPAALSAALLAAVREVTGREPDSRGTLGS